MTIHFPNNVVVITLSMLILHTVLIDITTVKGAPDTTVLNHHCGSETWATDDPYGDLVGHMLNELTVNCARNPNHQEFVEDSYGDIVAYGYATCGPHLNEDDCKACLAVAQDFLIINCPSSKTAWVELANCFLGYCLPVLPLFQVSVK